MSGSEVTYDDFLRVNLRVGVIKSAERVPGSRKLIKMMIDIGSEVRQIITGIADQFPNTDQLIGKRVVVVTNLVPKKMFGLESRGMILMAEDINGKLYFVTIEGNAPPGSRVY
ncbi:MAG: methionine--tRNA ligase subunit beta [Candidatus Methanomethylicia archaeon]